MSLEEQIKMLILQKYKSIRSFAEESGIKLSTLNSLLKKEGSGIAGAGFQQIAKICKTLNLSLVDLSNGVITELSDNSSDANMVYTNIEKLMNIKGLNYDKLAELSGMSEFSIRGLMARRPTSLDAKTAYDLAAAMGVSVEQLLGAIPIDYDDIYLSNEQCRVRMEALLLSVLKEIGISKEHLSSDQIGKYVKILKVISEE